MIGLKLQLLPQLGFLVDDLGIDLATHEAFLELETDLLAHLVVNSLATPTVSHIAGYL